MAEPESIRVMQATAKPYVWQGWSSWWRHELRDKYYHQRRARIRLQQLTDLNELNWRLRHPGADRAEMMAHANYFTPEQIRHINIINGLEEPERGSPPPGWQERQRAWQIWPVNELKAVSGATHSVVSRDASGGWWEGAGRGLPLGAALLAIILLLLRAADRCLHTNLFKMPMRRRRSEEWPTPNVMATSLAVRMTNDYTTRPPSPSEECVNRVDLPPPYSECLADGTPANNRQKPENEEPPPPYSACFVAYSNPKDGQPSVHFFTNQCQNLFANYEAGPSNVHDTGQIGGNLQDLEERSDSACSQSDTMEDREEDVLELDRNQDNAENTVDSEVEIKENTSVVCDRYQVM